MAKPMSSRADRFVQRLYTRGKDVPVAEDATSKAVRSVFDRLAQRRSQLLRRVNK